MPFSGSGRFLIIVGAVLLLTPVLLFEMLVMGNVGSGVLDSLLNRRPTVQELIGTYDYRASWGRASLQLEKDGTFNEQVAEKGLPTREIAGRWQARGKENYLDVAFEPFGTLNDEDHERLNDNSGMPFFKTRMGSEIYGLIDADLGEKFKKHQRSRDNR